MTQQPKTKASIALAFSSDNMKHKRLDESDLSQDNQVVEESSGSSHHPHKQPETSESLVEQVLELDFNENILPTLLVAEQLQRKSVELHTVTTTQSQQKTVTLSDTASEASENIPDEQKPWYRRRSVLNLSLFLFGTMFFKFSYETLSGAIGLTILNRLDGHPLGATTILSLLTIIFGVSQSVSSSLVESLLKKVRATRLYCMSLVFFALLIGVIIILEATTGGTLQQSGTWNPWIIFPIYIFIGFSIGGKLS